MAISLPQRVPENAPGDFYVQANCCTQCCLPHGEAGELMNDPSVDFQECYFRRQPETPDEVAKAIQAIAVSELSCLRYGGDDQTIIRRIHQTRSDDCCDQPLIGDGSIRGLSLASLLATALLATGPWAFLFPFAISSLPRPMQGEAVIVPWWICLASYFLLPTLIPFAISLALTRNVRLRLLVLIAFAAFTIMWYWAGGDDLLSKAWRRGL